MSATTKLNIGKIPISKGEYQEGTAYQRLNQVTMLGSTFQSIADDNVGYPPAEVRDDGKVYAINTDKWIIVANALAAYNAGKRIDDLAENTEIKDEEGTVVKTPFRYIQSEEFIFAMVDENDVFLAGIQWDGTPEFGKTSAVEDRLQAQVTLLAERVATIMGDEDTTSVIDTMNELKNFFATIDNTQTLTSILANLNTTIGKVAIKDEAGEIQDTPFRVISNEEFIKAIVDSDDKVLFGFYRATGEPYYPLNEMYHVIQNDEYFAAWITTDDKVVLGIRRDGVVIGEIHAVNALKQVISQIQEDLTSLQEKVGTIDTNLKELLDVFSLQENPEYLAVEQDAEGKVLSATNADGSHYFHNAKSETIPTEFEHIEDPEGRTEITTDAENKILGYRDSEGTRHEHKISANHINLSDEAAKEVNEAFKSAGIKMENPSNFSKDSHLELPIPRIAANVRIYAPNLPTTKTDNIEAEIEYNDKDGNYFRKPIVLNAQGSSSMNFYVKNLAVDFADKSDIKFGNFPTQDSFHLKKYYIDAFRGQCIVGYWLMEQVYKSHPLGQQYPYEYTYSNDSVTDGLGDTSKDFFTGAKCHPDGFPIVITWVNSKTKEETWMGVYAWNLKKSRDVYHCDKKKAENIILDGVIGNGTMFDGTVDWGQFEIRNPKSLKDINEKDYDGDHPKELSDTDSTSKKVKTYIQRLATINNAIQTDSSKETLQKFLLINPTIDYYLVSQLLYNFDGFEKNWIWTTWDGNKWCPTLYDVDSIFGSYTFGMYIIKASDTSGFPEDVMGKSTRWLTALKTLYSDEIKSRYKELRDEGIFDVSNIIALLDIWLGAIGYDNLQKEYKAYPQTPSYRSPNINDGWEHIGEFAGYEEYSDEKQYNEGDKVQYYNFDFKANKSIKGIPPVKLYDKFPYAFGCYNSPKRVSNWLTNRLAFLDKTFEYSK